MQHLQTETEKDIEYKIQKTEKPWHLLEVFAGRQHLLLKVLPDTGVLVAEVLVLLLRGGLHVTDVTLVYRDDTCATCH